MATKSALASGVLAMTVMIGLSGCVPPPPPPPPPAAPMPYVAPAPVPYAAPAPPPVAHRYCGPGRHWVAGHRNRRGRWVRGHCAPNRWR